MRARSWLTLSSLNFYRKPFLREPRLPQSRIIPARLHDSGYYAGDSNYNSLFRAGDGNIYFAVGSGRHDRAAQMFRFSPATEEVEHLADLGEVVGEASVKVIPQGKVHTNIFEDGGRLYAATHVGFYRRAGGAEQPGVVAGYEDYRGGHFFSYDLSAGTFSEVAKAPAGEGIIAMTMDAARKRLYGLTWPGGTLICCELTSGSLRDYGPVFGPGERGSKRKGSWRPVCRSLGLDPRSGNVYWSDADGRIAFYRHATDSVEALGGGGLKPGGSGSMWRSVFWHPKEGVFYGVETTSSQLFRFEPRSGRVELLGALRPESPGGRVRARWYKSPPATLAFRLGPDGETIHYLAVGPGLKARDGRRVRSTVHFKTFHIPSRSYRDHGVLRLPDGRYPTSAQSIEAAGGAVYSVCWIELPPGLQTGRAEKIRRARGPDSSHESPLEEVNLVSFPAPE